MRVVGDGKHFGPLQVFGAFSLKNINDCLRDACKIFSCLSLVGACNFNKRFFPLGKSPTLLDTAVVEVQPCQQMPVCRLPRKTRHRQISISFFCNFLHERIYQSNRRRRATPKSMSQQSQIAALQQRKKEKKTKKKKEKENGEEVGPDWFAGIFAGGKNGKK